MLNTIKKNLIAFLCLNASISFAQDPMYLNKIKFGSYQVAFSDSVIVQKNEDGREKAFFVSIWYPAQNDTSKDYMKYKDYWNFSAPDNLSGLKDSLQLKYQEIVKEYGVCSNTNNWRVHKFKKKQKRLFNAILNMSVNAKVNLILAEGKFPCIIYHHGNNGSNEDNSLFCEFMASHGYVVVSSNYEWPSYRSGFDERIKDISYISNWASNLAFVNKNKLIYAGHSWGAQMGFFMNARQDHLFKLFLSFDTTIEGKPLSSARNKWSTMDSLFTHHSHQLITPMLLFSTVQINYNAFGAAKKVHLIPKYDFFRSLKSTSMEFVTTKKSLEHNNFTSQGVIRAFHSEQIRQKDKKEINSQCEAYIRILELSKEMIDRQLNGSKKDLETEYKDDFIFEIVNQ